jgi:hypothetical protein
LRARRSPSRTASFVIYTAPQYREDCESDSSNKRGETRGETAMKWGDKRRTEEGGWGGEGEGERRGMLCGGTGRVVRYSRCYFFMIHVSRLLY